MSIRAHEAAFSPSLINATRGGIDRREQAARSMVSRGQVARLAMASSFSNEAGAQALTPTGIYPRRCKLEMSLRTHDVLRLYSQKKSTRRREIRCTLS